MNLTKQICHKAAHFDAVAFDVFDTLIKRDVAVPTGLFRLMGDDFYAARIRAEREARAAQSREVTLAEIYARPCLARYDAAAECAAELAACAANKPVLDAVQTLKKQGKKLYYISDMYLPQTQIDAMLRRCGYPCFDGGFVSCTYGVQKRSGRLFKRFLQETGLTARQLLFIGDSWRADVAGAALAGITAWHLPTPPAPADNAAAFVENRLPQQRSDGESLGFSVLGPLAAAFCQWLHAHRAARPEARLYFLARDMYLMRDVYHTLYPQEETGYLQVSRRSLAPAFLAAGAGSTLHGQANCFADWLRAALLVHPCGGQLRQLAGNLELPFVDTRSMVTITLPETTQPEQEQQPEELEPQAPAAADPALVEQLRAGFAWQYPAAALARVPAKVSVTSIVHKAEQTTLERPGFLSKDGLTAAEMGTALHAFLEHADFAALAEAKAAGTLDGAIGAERDRQAAAQLTAPEIAAKLDAVRIRRFVQSEAFAKICAAQQVLRELAFITALPAAEVLAAQGSPAPDTAPEAQVLVQGIADLVLVYPDHLELLDYKTDRRKTAADFVRAYKPQLDLYALAVGKRFAPKPVTYKGIYSLELGRLIEV